MKTSYRASLDHMMKILITLLLFFFVFHIHGYAQGTQTNPAKPETADSVTYEAGPSTTRKSASGSQDSQPEPSIRLWIGPDGHPLLFANDGEICDFLKTAKIISVSYLSTGITKPKKLLLEKDGIKAHAIFHYRHLEDRRTTLGNGMRLKYFRDSYLNQVAAYEMSRLLGITNVPPTVFREVNGKKGSVQLWIENAMTEKNRREKKIKLYSPSTTNFYTHDMLVFDHLINNIDRHLANIMHDANWQLWLIDHTRAFGRDPSLLDISKLRRCSRSLWAKLQSLDDQLISQTLEPYMNRKEIYALANRQKEIIKWLKEKIKKEGASKVLFDYNKP